MMPLISNTLFAFAIFLAGSQVLANEAVEPRVDGDGVVDLLAGGSLRAWDVPSGLWRFEDDAIVGDTGPEKITTPEWIYTKGRYRDFEFTCELRLSGDTKRNTGIYYRVNKFRFKDRFEAPSGYEFDAAYHDGSDKRNWRGSLGDWYARPKLRIFPDPSVINEAFKTDEWNRMTLRARGDRLEYWVNGVKVMDFVDGDPKGSKEGVIGFQIHDGSVMKVEYRNVRVLEL
ncbi:3-keto-disaccharide hydrolase [Pelagicoccus mobilis]|uniref:DUF1080 domain-containing protein n=1 Tax=Pelagicoccus mobilis TaxID=415221 RepID=A0A934S0R5_9BACT|nr:DUF1080 domain-containing protein [Pelagicoccus mobilis]MBK1876993.1 DUF1080 domain-containing protein [Pelagicoccus mobilis]